MTQYARFHTQTADLTTDFGYEMAVKWFGQDIVDELPKFVKGKNKGKPKGIYEWKKVLEGGWVRAQGLPNGGYVEHRRGSTIERKLCERISTRDGVMTGKCLHYLGQNETMQSRADEAKVTYLKEWAKDTEIMNRDIAEYDRVIAALHESDKGDPELRESLIKEYEEKRASDVAFLDGISARHRLEEFTSEHYDAAIKYYEGEIEFFEGTGTDTTKFRKIIQILEENK